MSDIDWSKAPADAQGFMPYDGMWISGWWKDDGGSRYFWSMEEGDLGEWKKSYANPFEQPGFIKRPSPAWNGDGLPPVGTVCEVRFGHWNEWEESEILCFGSTMVFVRQKSRSGQIFEGAMCLEGLMFQPIRTPEQIAADEREAAIDSMVKFFMNYYGNPKGAEQYLLICRSLHDAGYRKQADE